ncbi:MAG: radical SAM protein [Proteobacteria bacterium]|nr:radical SAM protein [Pseudomonadota bacterium]
MVRSDCIFVHVPKLLEWSPYFGWYSRITFLPMGMLSMIEEVDRAGFTVRLVHLGVEKALDPEWSLVDYVKESGATMVALSLNWHPQTFDTLDVARQLKASLPHIQVVVGGLTASVFAHHILRDFADVDAVIEGEAEVPLRLLLESKGDWRGVPNLWWRDEGKIRRNTQCFLSDEDEVTNWSFASWCAGSHESMAATTGRRHIAWRSPDAVVATVKMARSHGVKRFYACFDPHPTKPRELIAILEALGRLDEKVKLDFETYGLPTPKFVESFRQNLDSSSRLLLSPETVDETLRRRHRAFAFSNAEFHQTLEHLEHEGLRSYLYFVVGLPGEDRAGVLRTREYQTQLQQRFSCVDNVFSWPLEMEPNAPWFNQPQRFGLSLKRRNLADF